MISEAAKSLRYIAPKQSHRLFAVATLFLCALIVMSCASLRFSRELTDSAGSWNMFGKDAGHSSMAELTSTGLKKAWDNDVGGGFGNFSFTIKDGIAYVGTLKGEVYALDIATGKELASKNFGGAIFGGPAVSDSLIVVASSQSKGNVLAYDIYSGKTIWSKEIADVESSPTVYKNCIYLVTVKGDLYRIDLQTGREIFHQRIDGAIRTSPSLDDSMCVFGCDDGNVYAVNTFDGKQRWKYGAGSPVWCSPSMDDSTIFIGTNGGRLLALNKEGKMKFDFTTGEKILSMPITDEKRVYFGCDDGNFYAVDIQSGALIWKVRTDAPITTAASQTRTQIFFGGFDKNLYVIDKSNGKMEQKIELPGRIRTQPAIYKNHLAVGVEDSEVLGFEIK